MGCPTPFRFRVFRMFRGKNQDLLVSVFQFVCLRVIRGQLRSAVTARVAIK